MSHQCKLEWSRLATGQLGIVGVYVTQEAPNSILWDRQIRLEYREGRGNLATCICLGSFAGL